MKTRVRARIFGRVQGVGFRPTVYRYATQLGLGGFVCNTAQGVTLEVEGEDRNVGAFFDHLTEHPPRQAVIADIQKETITEKGCADFQVVESHPDGDTAAQIPPDVATCDECVSELFDPGNRRHGYPFINCTNCGPRFTIINELPYDRAQTSMATFAMCEPCDGEYHEPRDRRFHAQPNACEKCGPHLELVYPPGITTAASGDAAYNNTDLKAGCRPRALTRCAVGALAEATNLLRHGRIVAIKGLGGYHLACDAANTWAVARLRQRKQRQGKSFAVMFRDIETVKKYCTVSEAEEAELLSPARPIVLLERRSTGVSECWSDGSCSVGKLNTPTLPYSIAPDVSTIGAFLPYTPLHYLLMQQFDGLVMTSGNLTDEPIISDETELAALLGSKDSSQGPIADAALTHNRPIVHKCDDSVLRVINGQRQFFRRARGFVPNPIRLAARSRSILAVGGELKNTFCLVRNGYAFLAQHIGDLKEYRTYESYTHEIAAWQKLLDVEPEVVAHDLHPAYLSTKFAQSRRGPGNDNQPEPNSPSLHHSTTPLLIPVQHHHAHIASVMAEHDLHEPVIGVALDGTGYGTDGTIWGGEFLVADRADFERLARFKPYPLPGGDKAVAEPWRMAVSVLMTEGLWEQAGTHEREKDHPWKGVSTIQRMVETGFNSPLTSSAGRLFDAVAAFLGLCDVAAYEGQAAIRLEAAADARVTERYPFEIVERDHPATLNFGPAIRAIVEEKNRGVAVGDIAAKFHNALAAATAQVCCLVRGQRDIHMVALSGGVYQNALLLRRTVEALRAEQFAVYTNTLVPPNDGGLTLGQAAVAACRTGVSPVQGCPDGQAGRLSLGTEKSACV